MREDRKYQGGNADVPEKWQTGQCGLLKTVWGREKINHYIDCKYVTEPTFP